MARYDEITPPRSDTAFQPGGTKARDEARRAEQAQARQIKYGEKLDRNIARATRQGDGRKVSMLLNVKSAYNGGQIKAPGGIRNADDMEQRVKDGVVKGAEMRWEAGQIGRSTEDPIAGAPPVDSVTPKQREAINPYATAGAGVGTPIKRAEGETINSNATAGAGVGTPIKRDPNGSGPTVYDKLPEGKTGGVYVDVSNGPNKPSSTAQGAPASNPVAQSPTSTPQRATESFAETDARKRRESAQLGAFGSAAQKREGMNERQQFASDIDRSASVKSDPGARERAYQRGESIGVSRELVDKRMGWDKKKEAQDLVYESPKNQTIQKVDGSGRMNEPESVQLARKIQAEARTMSPEAKARSDKEGALITRMIESIVRATQEADALDPLVTNRAQRWADMDAASAAESVIRGKYIEQVAKDRDVWFEDVKKNASHARSAMGVIAAFQGQRLDEPMPAVDWKAFESRKANDPNFGGKRYESQYTAPEIIESGGVRREAPGKFVGKKKTYSVAETVGGTLLSLAEGAARLPYEVLKQIAKLDLEKSARGLSAPPSVPFPR